MPYTVEYSVDYSEKKFHHTKVSAKSHTPSWLFSTQGAAQKNGWKLGPPDVIVLRKILNIFPIYINHKHQNNDSPPPCPKQPSGGQNYNTDIRILCLECLEHWGNEMFSFRFISFLFFLIDGGQPVFFRPQNHTKFDSQTLWHKPKNRLEIWQTIFHITMKTGDLQWL